LAALFSLLKTSANSLLLGFLTSSESKSDLTVHQATLASRKTFSIGLLRLY
jgi:hypothetical protein